VVSCHALQTDIEGVDPAASLVLQAVWNSLISDVHTLSDQRDLLERQNEALLLSHQDDQDHIKALENTVAMQKSEMDSLRDALAATKGSGDSQTAGDTSRWES
jgi:hypothetical protein